MILNKCKVLITGGCGYIGSHTAVILLNLGFDIVLLDSNVNSSINVLKNISKISFGNELIPENRFSFYKGDIRDAKFLGKTYLQFMSYILLGLITYWLVISKIIVFD